MAPATNQSLNEVLLECWDALEAMLSMEAVSRLVMYLYSKKSLSHEEMESLEVHQARHQKIRALLKLLLSKGDGDESLEHMLDCLHKDGTNRSLHALLKASAEAHGCKWRPINERRAADAISNVSGSGNSASPASTCRATVTGNEAQAQGPLDVDMDAVQLWRLIIKSGVALKKWHMVVPFLVTEPEDQLQIGDLLEKSDYSGAVLKTLRIWEGNGDKKADLEAVLRERGLNVLADSIWGPRA